MTTSTIIPAWLALMLLAGCGSWTVPRARTALEHTAEAVQETDDLTAPLHQAAVDRAEDLAQAGGSFAEFDAILEPWRRFTMQLDTLRGALRSAELAVDAWERGAAGGKDGWLSAVGCVLAALENVARTLESVEAIDQLPDALRMALDYIGPRARRTCAGPPNEPNPNEPAESIVDPFPDGSGDEGSEP